MALKILKSVKKILRIGVPLLLMGSTISGAFAASYTLSDYPAPFIDSKGIFNGYIAVGQNAAASDTIGQAILLADLQTKAVTEAKGAVTSSIIENGVQEEIILGNELTSEFDEEITDSSVDSLIDSEVNFQGDDYDVQEVLKLKNDLKVETSLTTSEADYKEGVKVEYARDSIKYFMAFDNDISLNETKPDDPLEISFLGQRLKIIDVNSDTKFTAEVSPEFFMIVGDKKDVGDKTVKLSKVGGNAVIVDVDGKTEIISKGMTETVNGIEVKVESIFYESNAPSESAANLVIGSDAVQTIKDGDAYIGEDKKDPQWIWNVANLNSGEATDIGNGDGIIIGIENDNIMNDDSDNPPSVGDCINLPNNYLNICFDSLNVDDEDYAQYTIEYDDAADLSDVNSTLTSVKTLYIHTDASDGLVLGNSGKKTEDIWLYGADGDNTEIYYKDEDGDLKIDQAISKDTAQKTFARLNYQNTKGDDLKLNYNFTATLGLVEVEPSVTGISNDKLTSSWTLVDGNVRSLGATLNEEETDELKWDKNNDGSIMNIGTNDDNMRTRYGIIVEGNNGDSDKVVLNIPRDTVKANMIIGGTSTKAVAKEGKSKGVTVNPIPSSAAVLSEELSNPESSNLIIVGGPAINPLAKLEGFPDRSEYEPNTAFVMLRKNGAKIAMLVAGYSATDTKLAAESIVAGKLKNIKTMEARITTSGNSVTIEDGATLNTKTVDNTTEEVNSTSS